jgi:hypothetical protein
VNCLIEQQAVGTNASLVPSGNHSDLLRTLPMWVCTTQASNGAECQISVHEHTRIVLNMPSGLGPFAELRVSVVTLTTTAESLPAVFNYSAPLITAVTPNPLNARGGELVTISGDNLGVVGVGPRPLIHLNGTC